MGGGGLGGPLGLSVSVYTCCARPRPLAVKKIMLVAPLKWRGCISALQNKTRPLDVNMRV